jgi:hypothetical protein
MQPPPCHSHRVCTRGHCCCLDVVACCPPSCAESSGHGPSQGRSLAAVLRCYPAAQHAPSLRRERAAVATVDVDFYLPRRPRHAVPLPLHVHPVCCILATLLPRPVLIMRRSVTPSALSPSLCLSLAARTSALGVEQSTTATAVPGSPSLPMPS